MKQSLHSTPTPSFVQDAPDGGDDGRGGAYSLRQPVGAGPGWTGGGLPGVTGKFLGGQTSFGDNRGSRTGYG